MIKTAQKNSKQNFVAVASRTPGKAQEFAKAFGIADFYTSYEELAARSDNYAIYIGTLPGTVMKT